MDRRFQPGPLLRSPHVQTMIGSRGRGRWVRQRAASMLASSQPLLLSVNDGVRLQAWLSIQPVPAPAVILIHGWLGHADSSYVLSAAAELWNRGFSVFRLNLRDHGNTAHLNVDLFNSARIEEVINAVIELREKHATGPCGLAGFSLGGNFALRVARACQLETVAICPAVDPHATMATIDGGSSIYRLFFINKWHRSMRAKEAAFPDRYRFDSAYKLKTVTSLTELFVQDHTPFESTDHYLDAYSLLGNALEDTSATILFAADDPVIPASGFNEMPNSLTIHRSEYGGHCAFVTHLTKPSWADRYLLRYFTERFR